MELTPDIVGRSTGHSRFTDPWFDEDHDGDIALVPTEPAVEAPSARTTMPPRAAPRSVPPAFDTTFMMHRPSQSTVETRSPAPAPMPEAARRQGGRDTLLSASWFHDASEASEWREVAEEKRAAGRPAAVARRSGFRLWIVAAVVASVCLVGAAGTGLLTVLVSAIVLLT